MSMDEALQTFVTESRELLQDMEESLLQIEQTPGDKDLINAIFRSAHTIKGSAGLFGLDPIVALTHVAESVLDRIRSDELALSHDLGALFLEVADQLAVLVEVVAEKTAIPADIQQQSDRLQEQLQGYLQSPATADTSGNSGGLSEHQQPCIKEAGEAVETDNWHISLRFTPECLRNGMDPFSFIRYLATLGRIVNLVTLTDALPVAAEMDPEVCYFGFEIAFSSEASKAEIDGVFEFVREDSTIRIIPPRSKISEYLELIDKLPEEDLRLGEILLRCGTLTETELEQTLSLQQRDSDDETGNPLGELLVSQNMVEAPVVEAALEKQQQVKSSKSLAGGTIRVDAGKLDQLINLVGELIVAGASANLLAQTTGNAELLESNAVVSRLVEEVRDSALTLRMVQIGATFSRFKRIVRDVSRELGKDITLEIEGADTELDKTVVENIGDPLTHLVRNAMDHGIEPADVRQARGKPAKGKVRLNAYHDSGSIVIEVADDGGGLNRDKILAKAVERGVVAADQALSDQEVYNLIFEPGFSTADSVSNLSGRGVGMDVVRRNIQALRGEVTLDSEEGKGSTVKISLPLTLAIIDGFLVGIGNHSYVIPLDMVDECVELSAWQNNGGDGHYLNLRGEVLPFMKMRHLFSVPGTAPKRENVVVVKADGKKAGLVVDWLMGEFQTVIKPLGKLFSHTQGLSGFTILGSGEVALILDVASLIDNSISSEKAVFEGMAEARKQASLGLTHDTGEAAR